MIYKNVELHNFEEVREIPGRQGVLLQRIPENVRLQLRPGAQEMYKRSGGGEIRFVSEWEPVKVTLASYGGNSNAALYFGGFQAGEYAIGEDPAIIEIPVPELLSKIDTAFCDYCYSPAVRRLILNGHEVHFIDIEGPGIRPPGRDELPKLRYLAYGTSITQGSSSTTPSLSYVRQAAWRLDADVLNHGVGGNAFCEKELADYLASGLNWDFTTLCLSVNMLNQGVCLDEFSCRASYMVNEIAGKNPGKPVVCISLFPFFLDMGLKKPQQFPLSTPGEYREALKYIVEASKLPNLYFIDGPELLQDFQGLSCDLLHPGNMGMIQIGENLAGFIRKLL